MGPFSCRGLTLAHFRELGNLPVLMLLFIMAVMGAAMTGAAAYVGASCDRVNNPKISIPSRPMSTILV